MKKYNILDISPTPLVASPQKISHSLNQFSDTYTSNCIIFSDYPNKLNNLFSANSINFQNLKELSLQLISDADIIHVHNFLSLEQEDILLNNVKSSCKFILQIHSPLREGPLFVEYGNESKIKYDKKCVVGQYHTRLFPKYTMVPNLVLDKPSVNLIKDDEIPVVLFSPSHSRTGGRWNDKTAPELEEILKSLHKLDIIELKLISNVKPYELFQIRRKSHISIDEIITGSYHQVSLESLACGNVTINNSDFFSNLTLKNMVNSDDEVPFFKLSLDGCKTELLKLVNDKKLIRDYQQKSFDYYSKHLNIEKLTNHYINIYNEVINND